MKKSWWRSKGDLDAERKAFVESYEKQRTALTGPPGSGKTNLLLLRAELTTLNGKPNILIVTYTKTMAKFIKTGISLRGIISEDKVRNFHSWVADHVLDQLNERITINENDFDEEARQKCLESLKRANNHLSSKKVYDAIFVDEAQDLSKEELEELLSLSENVCIAGDANQGIFQRDGLCVIETLNLVSFKLKNHFRIGHNIAKVADKIFPPNEGEQSIESTSNYNSQIDGESSAHFHRLDSRDSQFNEMLKRIKIQLVAFPEETIGIICGKRDTCQELRNRFNDTDVAHLVAVHGVDSFSNFSDERLIHVITIHSAKGTEFKSVHMYGVEELDAPHLRRTRLSYTAVTRAKTALNVYCTGKTTAKLESAFAQQKRCTIEDIFDRE